MCSLTSNCSASTSLSRHALYMSLYESFSPYYRMCSVTIECVHLLATVQPAPVSAGMPSLFYFRYLFIYFYFSFFFCNCSVSTSLSRHALYLFIFVFVYSVIFSSFLFSVSTSLSRHALFSFLFSFSCLLFFFLVSSSLKQACLRFFCFFGFNFFLLPPSQQACLYAPCYPLFSFFFFFILHLYAEQPSQQACVCVPLVFLLFFFFLILLYMHTHTLRSSLWSVFSYQRVCFLTRECVL